MSKDDQLGFGFGGQNGEGIPASDLEVEEPEATELLETSVDDLEVAADIEVEEQPSSRAEAEKSGQIPLISIGEWWEHHWRGMPEFVQDDLKPWKSIYVHFESREDMDRFAKLVGQRIGLQTKFIWYPEAEISRYVRSNRRYVDAP